MAASLQKPAVLLVHGFGAFGEQWRGQIKGLTEAGYQVLITTLPHSSYRTCSLNWTTLEKWNYFNGWTTPALPPSFRLFGRFFVVFSTIFELSVRPSPNSYLISGPIKNARTECQYSSC